MVAALLQAGAILALPANCFGDIWHGTGRIDPTDGFARLGLTLARKALAFAEQALSTDPSRRFAWGTSVGAHGIAELVVAGESLVRVIADSPPDCLPGPYGDPSFDPAREGLRRIFEGDDSAEHVGALLAPRGIADPARSAPTRRSLRPRGRA